MQTRPAAYSFVALLLFETRNLTTQAVLYSEEMYLLRAASPEEARSEAQGLGQRQETGYRNADGQALEVRLWRVLDVQRLLYDDPSQGPLYVRHFRNRAAYEAFEPLLDGEL